MYVLGIQVGTYKRFTKKKKNNIMINLKQIHSNYSNLIGTDIQVPIQYTCI